MSSLSDRLKSLGVHLGTSEIKTRENPSTWSIERVIKGYDHETVFGNAFIVEINYDEDYAQGQVGLLNNLNLGILSAWADQPAIKEIRPEEIVFMDTETSGLAGGTGTYIFLIGIGYRIKSGFRLLQIFLRDPSQERAFLASITSLLGDTFKAVVTFNGKSFDMPLLKSRHVLNAMENPFHPLLHIDLLPLARRLWRSRLPSRSLKDLEREILHMARSEAEVPGWMVPDLYFDYLKNGDARPLVGVFYHNAMDIVSLDALLNHMDELIENPLGQPETPALDLAAIAKLHQDIGLFNDALKLYDESLSQGLPLDTHLLVLSRAADLARKTKNWEKAIDYWKKAAEFQQVDACISLSKYFEHKSKDITSAIHWVEKARSILQSQPKGSKDNLIWGDDLSRRLVRLKKVVKP